MKDIAQNSFESSLEATEPRVRATPSLRSLWYGLRGDWTKAHEIVQAEDDRGSAWVHAWLHRVEGDLPNAAYWYGRVGRALAQGETRTEGLEIAGALGTRTIGKTSDFD